MHIDKDLVAAAANDPAALEAGRARADELYATSPRPLSRAAHVAHSRRLERL